MNWTLGTLVVFWVLIPFTVFLIIVTALCARHAWRNDSDGAGVTAIFTGLFALCFIVGMFIGMYPYEAQYHSYTPFSGQVEEINSRLIGIDGGSEQKFVVKFVGNDVEYGVYDTRMASVEPGQNLSLQCVREWQFEGIDGWDCAFNGVEK